ncbi:hypothetical protein GCM10017600_08770 [Streptosporangium carneum]|uniref:Uncharacterized protein n=1 Tax=Streptosporangium carneum TaxID=47481 RepID=A0A9W6HW79_9ACTN|nr:hypothetical protein GCM10017600_08770 [Streptosporangium carneum]
MPLLSPSLKIHAYLSATGALTFTVVDSVTVFGQTPVWVFGEAEAVPKTTGFGAACAPGAKAQDARATTATSPPIRRPALPDNPTTFLSYDLQRHI